MRIWKLALLILACGIPLAGCAPTKKPVAKPQAPLTESQRQANLASFDQVWITIRDEHWDPTLGGMDWEAVRVELRPQVEQAMTMDQARAVMDQMIERLKQSHFAIIPADVYHDVAVEKSDTGEASSNAQTSAKPPESAGSGENGVTGIDVRVIDGSAVVTRVFPDTPAAAAGVKPGWIVQKIGARQVAPVLKQVEQMYAESSLRDAYLRGAVIAKLSGDIGDDVNVTFLDGRDKPVQLTLKLAKPPGAPAKLGNLPTFYVTFESKLIPPNIGYITFSAFFDPGRIMTLFNEAMTQFHNADGIILDLRGNPGGLGGMAMGIGGFFVDTAGQKLGTMITRDSKLNFVLNPRPQPFMGPLAILVDGDSASTSEILAGGLQDLKRARVFGTQTPAAALPSVVVKLPNGDRFQYAMANYISTGGEPLEARGVKPDEIVQLDRASLLAGNDPVIAAAVQWIESQKKKLTGAH